MSKSTRSYALILLFFNGASAVYGGGSLILDPTGQLLQLPIAFLEPTPFDDFLIPGILLFTVNGLFNLYVAILGIMKRRRFAMLTILCGLLLCTWLTVQVTLIRQFSFLAHGTYYVVGLLMIITGFKLKGQQWVQ